MISALMPGNLLRRPPGEGRELAAEEPLDRVPLRRLQPARPPEARLHAVPGRLDAPPAPREAPHPQAAVHDQGERVDPRPELECAKARALEQQLQAVRRVVPRREGV